jgi:hypothetical protein
MPYITFFPPESSLDSSKFSQHGHVLSANFESLLSFPPRVVVNVRGSLHLTLPLFRGLMQLIKLLSIIPILALPSEGTLARLGHEVS